MKEKEDNEITIFKSDNHFFNILIGFTLMFERWYCGLKVLHTLPEKKHCMWLLKYLKLKYIIFKYNRYEKSEKYISSNSTTVIWDCYYIYIVVNR